MSKMTEIEGYNGLYNEVVKYDCYHLRNVPDEVSVNNPNNILTKGHSGIDFVPDIVFDLGANVGCFTRYARSLFPNAKIISVEPDKDNFKYLSEETIDTNTILINGAIGINSIYHQEGSRFGGSVYLSGGLGYPESEMDSALTKFDIPLLMVDDLYNKYANDGDKVLFKIDIEGNEHTILTHNPSMDILKTCDYICMEMHFYQLRGGLGDVRGTLMNCLEEFDQTHNVSWNHVNFLARKKH